MNYYDEMCSWAKYFGKENILVRPYEKKQLSHGVVYDFYINVLDFSKEEYENLESTHENEGNSRINRDVLEYKRLSQIHGIEGEFVKVSNVLGEVHKNQSFLHPSERKKILDDCRESNSKLAIEFLSRNDGLLFFDTEIKKAETYEGLTIEKSIEISSKLINLFLYDKNNYMTILIV